MSNLQLKFLESGGQDDHSVRADALGAALTGIQRVFMIIGDMESGSRKRAANDERSSQSFALLCERPKQGCYDVPLKFHPTVAREDHNRRKRMLDNFFSLTSSIEEGAQVELIQKFKDESRLKAALTEMIRISGHCSGAGAIIFQDGNKRKFDFHGNRENLRSAKKAVTKGMSIVSECKPDTSIIANLKHIDAKDFIMHFEHSTEKTPLTFSYASADPSLAKNIADVVKSKSNPLEIHGDIKFDKAGYPEKIKQLRKLNHVNLQKVVIKEVSTNAGAIKADKPLTFHPELDETGAVYIVDVHPFGNILFETTRSYLVEEIEDYLSSIWNYFVMEDDGKLSKGAQDLKAIMLKNFKLKGEWHEAARNRGSPC